MKFFKKPLPVEVRFAREAGEVATLEGRVVCSAGDAILHGAQGDRWPVQRAQFEAAYRPVPPLRMGEDGRYRKQHVAVDASCLSTALDVALSDGRGVLHGQPGDWLVTDADGSQWIVEAGIFSTTYEAAP